MSYDRKLRHIPSLESRCGGDGLHDAATDRGRGCFLTYEQLVSFREW